MSKDMKIIQPGIATTKKHQKCVENNRSSPLLLSLCYFTCAKLKRACISTSLANKNKQIQQLAFNIFVLLCSPCIVCAMCRRTFRGTRSVRGVKMRHPAKSLKGPKIFSEIIRATPSKENCIWAPDTQTGCKTPEKRS